MNTLLDLCRVYHAYIKINLLKQFQYKMELLIWLIGRVLEPVIYLVVWTTVAQANGGAVGIFTTGDFAAYFLAEMLVNDATYTVFMWEYEYRVRNGALSSMLLRPLHPLHADLAETISTKFLTSLVMLPTAAFLMIAFQPALHLSLWTIVAFIPALVLAFALRFLMEWTLAMAAFWTTRVTAINQLYFVVMLFLSGQMTPLSLLPAPIEVLAMVLPFRWVVAFPIELLLGRLTPTSALSGLAAQGAWLLFMLAMLTYVWRTAVRRYSAVGA